MDNGIRVVMLGAPGSGKGTQGEMLAAQFGLTHISTGEVLRRHMREGTSLGNSVTAALNSGNLVPDDVVNAMVADLIDGLGPPAGYVLDGYPRTVAQAEALARTGHPPNAVAFLEVPDDELTTRLRRRAEIAEQSGARRDDDTDATVRHRLSVYAEATAPLINHYAAHGSLVRIDGLGSTDAVFSRLVAGLDNHIEQKASP